MKVLLADKLAPRAVTGLQDLGLKVDSQPDLTAETLPTSVRDVDILVVRSTKVTSQTLQSAPQLGLVIRAGSGVNTIDVETASRLGVHVANCPGKNADAVAELTIGLLIAADRRIVNATCDLRSGSWRKKEYGNARGLKTRRLGLLGFGAIGQSVARRALGLEMEVSAWSRSLNDQQAARCGVQYGGDPLRMARECDAISIHLPLTDDTRHVVNAEFMNAMPDGAILINTSRGELVDTSELAAIIAAKQLRVALDVFENEPAGGECDFAATQLAGLVTCTPHIGASTDQTSEAIADEVVRIVREYLASGRPPGSVNLCEKSSADHQLVVRHLNQVGVLASVLDGLKREQINIEEMENTIFAGEFAASCTMRLDGSPSAELLSMFEAMDAILKVNFS